MFLFPESPVCRHAERVGRMLARVAGSHAAELGAAPPRSGRAGA